MFSNKKILITGGSGMIGRELVNLLNEENAIIHIADLNEPINMSKKIKYYSVDLREFSNCLKICKGIDYVFNLVGIKCSPKECLKEPAKIIGPMLQFNTNMLEAAMMSKVKWYLYTSTVGVYEPAEILKEDAVWKTQPSKNDWFGGWAKRIGELQCKAYEIQNGIGNCSIVRPANVYGAYDNFNSNSAMVIPSLIKKANESSVLEVWGDGSEIRDFIHAKDVAKGMMFAVKNRITTPINLGSGTGHSIKKIAEIISGSYNIPIKWLVEKPRGDKMRVFDMSKANSLGFFPSVTIEEGIKQTIEWFSNNKRILKRKYNVFEN